MFQISEKKNWLYSLIPQVIAMLIQFSIKVIDYDYVAILDTKNPLF